MAALVWFAIEEYTYCELSGFASRECVNMFTGIVQGVGTVTKLQKHAGGVRLGLSCGETLRQVRPGDSVCVGGVCLTVAALTDETCEFDVIGETLAKTSLNRLRAGDRINIEPSLRAGDRIDGHFVQGHVEGTGVIHQVIATPKEHAIWIRPCDSVRPYLIPKGSVALDGVSMTIAALREDAFSVAVIPTTLERTTLGRLVVGDAVNIESDMMVRAVVETLRRWLGEGGADFSVIAPRFLEFANQSDMLPKAIGGTDS